MPMKHFILLLLVALPATAQQIILTNTIAEADGALQLHWGSQSNAFYRIEYRSALDTNSTWTSLYEDYPSHGTNTFWRDTGSDLSEPRAAYPADVMKRFYRVAVSGTNGPVTPSIIVRVPTNNFTARGDFPVSVEVNAPRPLSSIRLFVDGQEVESVLGISTNFVVNSCQFSNGVHQVFAVAELSTGAETTDEPFSYDISFGLSPFVTVRFSNDISEFRASANFVSTDDGERLRFSARLRQEFQWTLTITNAVGTVVKTFNGTGATVALDWDGFSTTGQRLTGFHTAVLTVQSAGGGLSPAADLQVTSLKPPKVMNAEGNFAIAYQGHHPAGTLFSSSTGPPDGLGGRVQLNTANFVGAYQKLKSPIKIAGSFAGEMFKAGLQKEFIKGDDQLTKRDLVAPLYGGISAFNRANIGLLIGHGVFGSEPDFTISFSGPLTSYYPIYKTGATAYEWTPIAACSFGSEKLRWMCILTCNNLHDTVYDDMYNKESLPINDDLHLLCGSKTVSYMVSDFGKQFGGALNGAYFDLPRQTIREAWFFAGQRTQSYQTNIPLRTVTFRVAGWPACMNDDLVNWSAPDSGNPADIFNEERTVAQ